MIDEKRLGELCETATPGPWQWYGNTKQYEVYLATTHGGRRFVMDFARWGMGGAQPRFQVTIDGGAGGGVMRSLADLAGGDERAKEKGLDLPTLGPLFEVDYRRQFVGIGHPDAEFIAAAREAVPQLLASLTRVRAALTSLESLCTSLADDFDSVLAAHDRNHPRHPSKGGQHHNGPCCDFGNVSPGAVREFRFWRDRIDAATKREP